jgi:hypothetical protein
MTEPALTVPPIEAARRFAALSGPFDPVDALPRTLAHAPQEAVLVASQLAWVCDTSPTETPGKWLLRTAERRDILRDLSTAGQLVASISARRSRPTDQPTRDLLDALLDEGEFAHGAVANAIRSPDSREHLERLIVTLDRAGGLARAYMLLAEARSALSQLQRDEHWRSIARQGVFGREAEAKTISVWLANNIEKPPVQALYVQGLPGIGKSLLLDDSVRRAYAHQKPIVIRLDFDRSGLDVLDLVGLTMEVARQTADQTGSEPLLKERLRAASLDSRPREGTTSALRSRVPLDLVAEIGKVVRSKKRPVLVLLDTLEMLRARGETHPRTLFQWLDDLVLGGVRPMRVLAAGRGGALDASPARIGKPIALDGLPEPAAGEMLAALNVPAEYRNEVIAVADGNPLVLRLAAALVLKGGGDTLRGKQGNSLSASFLYRALISRIADPELKRIVHPGLVVRRINAEVIRDVIVPKLGLKPVSEAASEALWRDLERLDWLVEPDPNSPKFLRPRGYLRPVLLPLIYKDQPVSSGKIDAAAAAWFARRPEPWCQIEASYHRLQMMRRQPSSPPLVERDIALQFDTDMLADLPAAAQNLVHSARGERSMQYRASSGGDGDDAGLARELAGVVERQDWIEGEYIIQRAIDTGSIGARSQAADTIREFWWRSGRWLRARQMLRDRDLLASGDDDIRILPPGPALARLEMRAEFQPLKLQRWLREDSANGPYAAGLVMTSPDGVGKFGALGYLLETGGARQWRPLHELKSDPVAIAVTYWADQPDPRILDTFVEANSRLQARNAGLTDLPPDDPAGAARLLAVFNPYVPMAINQSIHREKDWIAASAKAADDWLSRRDALLPWDAIPGLPSGQGHPVLGVASLGLFAEWAQAIAFIKDDSDMRLVGRSAEAWRRTAAGQWRYGRPPPPWVGAGAIDATMSQRLSALLADRDPVAAAFLQLGLWSSHPDGSGEEVWKRIRGRVQRAAEQTGTDTKGAPVRCLELLLQRRMPSAFAPAAATLGILRKA